MHIVIQKFIDGFNSQSRLYKLAADCLTSEGVRLEVLPSTDADAPTGFRLSFPSTLDFSDAMYPMLLLLFVFGKQFDPVGLMARQAAVVKSGQHYTERIGDWTYGSYLAGARWHMDISAP
jgi:hypothetical protein